MKVFVSSVVDGYENYRAAAKDAIEALGQMPCLMEMAAAASPRPPQAECFREIEASDVVVMLLGSRYGTPQDSGRSPTHEEYDHARELGKPILVFVEQIDDREPQQESFLSEISGWEEGYFRGHFSTEIQLTIELVKALKQHSDQSATALAPVSIERLPPVCRERLELLRQSVPEMADRLVEFLSDPAWRQPGALSELARQPPSWLSEAGYLAWEAISDFLDAHNIGGSNLTREMAIAAGSPRHGLYLARQAIAMAENGNRAGADELVARVQSDHPLKEIARAQIANEHSAVVAQVNSAGLLDSEDSDLARFAVSSLVSANWHLDRFDLATRVLKEANSRFPGRAWLLLMQAHATLGMVDQAGLDAAGSHDLLNEAAELALQSRDLFRDWDGPSHLAVDVEMRARLFLDDPQRAVDLALMPPAGEATLSEAADPSVQTKLARAYLILGQFREIDNLRLDQIDEFELALIRAMQARGLDDPTAHSKMRRALALASDEASRRQALMGLASFGEVDETAMSSESEEDSALFQGVAALSRGDLAEAVAILGPFRFVSFNHAYYLAQAQRKAGAIDEAKETLTEVAEHLGVESLREIAVEVLFENQRFDEAARIAVEALARTPSEPARHRLRTVLARIAEVRADWQEMEAHARALVRESPHDIQAAWWVVYALHRQLENRQAWAYLVGHDLVPIDEEMARLAIAVCIGVDAPEANAGLLEIAAMYSDSEQVTGSALVALMAEGDQLDLSDEELLRFHELRDDFFERYPESNMLRAYSSEDPEQLVEQMMAGQQEWVERVTPFVDKVRYGHVPYGLLRHIRELPYAELLLSFAAGDLTAIPADVARRDREFEAARQALEARIAVDTSVVVLGIHTDLDICRIASGFHTVLVADELIIDARVTVASASQMGDGVLVYEPGLGRPSFWEIDDDQRTAAIRSAENTLELLGGWQVARSGHIGPLTNFEDADAVNCRPWDSSVRLALERGCPLWCDDLGLRSLAESEGVVTFGTWALYEALKSTPDGSWLPTPDEMKMRFLRARIADVPITIAELERAVDDGSGPDIAFEFFLSRPLAWLRDPSAILNSYLGRVRNLIQGPHKMRVAGLLQAACYGLGAAKGPSERRAAMGGLLGVTLFSLNDPDMTPALVAFARYAAGKLDPAARLDPLEDAVLHLLRASEGVFGANEAAQVVRWLFSQAEPDDRHTVTAIMFAIHRD